LVRLAVAGRDVLTAAGLGVVRDDIALAPVLLAELDATGGRDGVLVLPLGGVAALVVAGCGGGLSLLCGCTLAVASGGTVVPVVASEAFAA